ncbi:MAG: hypothetical protein ACO3UU_11280 [Minisyncoccia bacterium]
MKDRNVIWIKIYRQILEDYEWHNLSSDSKATLLELLLLASENNGQLPEVHKIAFRLRKTEDFINEQIGLLSHWLQLDNNLITTCEQDVALEKSREEKSKTYVRFDEFWNTLLPKRRVNRKGCIEKWKNHNLDTEADNILSWLKQMNMTKEWKEGFNPSPEVIINQRRWEDGITKPTIKGRVL